MKFPVKTVAVILGVVAIILIAGFALGFLQGPVNNPCPNGVCSGNNPPVYISIVATGTVQNPIIGNIFETFDSLVGSAAAGPPPAAFFAKPGWLFVGSGFQITPTYQLTYPNGGTYSYTGSVFTGSVGGGPSSTPWTITVYNSGPRGQYTVTFTVSVVLTGCWPNNICSGGPYVFNKIDTFTV